LYLVDTDVISAAAPSKAAAPAALVQWMEAHSAALHLSAVTVAEIEDGIARARRRGARRQATALAAWLETLLHLHAARILAFDLAVARIAGRLSDLARGKGHAPGFPDIMIAATARQHRLTVLTRNLRHFAPLEVPALDPFRELPR
jgi:hypothetical protein